MAGNVSSSPNNTFRTRLGGSAFTVFFWNTHLIAFARQIAVQSPQPVGPGTVPIHPMDHSHPLELLTPAAATMGSLTLELYELYNEKIWSRLDTFGGQGSQSQSNTSKQVDIVGIFKAVYAVSQPIIITKFVKPPGSAPVYNETYHNCVVSNIIDGETIEIGTMEIVKQMVINYTHVTQGDATNPAHRDADQLGANPTQSDWTDSA